jgi:hypothetical protein
VPLKIASSSLKFVQIAARVSELVTLKRSFLNKATADPNFTATNRVFDPKIFVFRPFCSVNSNTPDESVNYCFKIAAKTVLVDVLGRTPGHFLSKSVRGYHFFMKTLCV